MNRKIQTLAALKKNVERLKKQDKIIVFTNGCFDILHQGHLKTFKEAKKKGDVLIVGVNSDSSVRKIKGPKRPIINQDCRLQVLAALELVDYVILFNEETPYNLIKIIKPHILIKGGDWTKDKIIGKEFVQKVSRIKLFPGYSTTKIIEKIIKIYGGNQTR